MDCAFRKFPMQINFFCLLLMIHTFTTNAKQANVETANGRRQKWDFCRLREKQTRCLISLLSTYFPQARLDSTKRVIRAREERVSMRRIERQFLSMAVVMLMLVGVVLSINTVTIYRVRYFVHGAEVYFHCLQVSGTY